MIFVIVLLVLAWLAGMVFLYLMCSALHTQWNLPLILSLILWPLSLAIVFVVYALSSPKKSNDPPVA